MIYVYRCPFCGTTEERELPMADSCKIQLCAVCGRVLQKVITQCNFILTGKGWGKDAAPKKTEVGR